MMKAAVHCRSISQKVELSRPCRAILLAILAMFAPALAESGESYSETLAVEIEGLDFDMGIVSEAILGFESDGTDIRIAYNALWSPGAVVVPGGAEGVAVAYVWDVPFEAVTADWIPGLSFSLEFIDAPIGPYDTVVVRTDMGAVFKLGNAFETDIGVSFDYAPL